MLLTWLALWLGIVAVGHGLNLKKKCIKVNGTYEFTGLIDLQGQSFQYITFVNSTGGQLRAGCGTENGQLTGTGTELDPYQIVVTVNPSTDINLGSPDCGHVANGNVLTWQVLVVFTLGPFPGTTGHQVQQSMQCDFDTVGDPSTGVSVNSTGEQIRTVILTQTQFALEFLIIQENLQEYPPNEPFRLGDTVRLRLRAVNNITGLYGYNCEACNTPACNDLRFPILDSNGCKVADFVSLLGVASASTQPNEVGTYMIGHLSFPGLDLSIYAGMAFTEEFTLFRFINTNDVYFSCNVGYCLSPTDANCVQHCQEALRINRGRRSVTTDEEDKLTAVIKVEGDDRDLIIRYPSTSAVRDDPNSTYLDPLDCMEKPEYIGVLATLGIMVLTTVALAVTFGVKVSRMKA